MTQLPQNLQRRVETLKLKTVENGATSAEFHAAQEMIKQIYLKYNSLKQLESDKLLTKSDFELSYMNGSLENKILLFDWDILAKDYFDDLDYNDYVYNTRLTWEKYSYTYYKVNPPTGITSISKSDYRKATYKAFIAIFRRNHYDHTFNTQNRSTSIT